MTTQKYSIFNIQGGLGKHIAATAVAKAIKNNHPDRKLIVVCAYPDIFLNLEYVDRVYALNNTEYFYQTYIQDIDSLIFYHEPYFTTEHIHKKLPLIENWCKLYNLQYNNEMPELEFTELQRALAANAWKRDKPIMLLHTNGGIMMSQAKPYLWTRDMPVSIAVDLYEHYKEDYHIIQVTKLNSFKIPGAEHLYGTVESVMSTMDYLSVLLASKKQILIDSSLQHAAAALNKKSVVLWNGTSPAVFGYDMHTNICASIPKNHKLPNSYLFDFSFEGIDSECPHKNIDNIFDVASVIKAIDSQ